MAPSPRKRLASPRKRPPPAPAPFNQTWHETDAAHLDPNALPVARIPRGWERKRQVKQGGDGKEKSIWRRFSLRSSAAAAAEQDETDEDEQDAQARAVKRRQRLSPKAMEKMQPNTRAFMGTRWDRRKSVLPRKTSARAAEALHDDHTDSDDTQDHTDADMSHESLAEAPHKEAVAVVHVQRATHAPSSFSFAMDAAHPVDQLPDYESLDEHDDDRLSDYESPDEHDDDQKLGNILPEDSTFALIFRSPAKSTSTPLSTSPAKVDYPALPPPSEDTEEALAAFTHLAPEALTSEAITVTGPTVESVAAEVVATVPTSTIYIPTHSAQSDPETTDAVESPHEESPGARPEDAREVVYPALLPAEPDEEERALSGDEDADADMSEIQLDTYSASVPPGETNKAELETPSDLLHHNSVDEDFTEASMQLNIQEDYEREGELASQPPTPKSAEEHMPDITDGLTLSTTPAKREHTPKRLHSPPPPLRIETGLDDATMTVAIDDDTAILKSFLSRAAASKAERSAIITRRESLENRRDSDIVRHALASPRKALEEKDPNSPSKINSESTFDLAATPALSPEIEDSASPTLEQPEVENSTDAKTGRGSRRSSRAKKSRLPAPAATTQPQASNKIAIRRADGTDPVVLKKTDAQELALITKNNTRKNKQGAFMVSLRLLKLQAEAILSPSPPLDDETPRDPVPGRRGIRWDETLAYYQEHADTLAAQQAEADSLATPDELSIPAATSTKKAKAKTPTDKNSTPKIRRVRGLGTANGTPGKGLLSTGSLLPDAVHEEQAAAAPPAPAAKGIPKPRISKKLPVAATPADSKLPALEIAAVGVEPVKERKSRLATPKSVRLPKPVAAAAPVAAAEKENTRTGISGATPRKGIPAPKIVAPKTIVPPTAVGSVGVESGLPRRRGRKV